MAETGTRPEIEDVLASIRRLVSQESPRVAQSYPTPHRAAEVDPLLLTPAQLVNEDDEEAPAPHVWSGEEAELARPAASRQTQASAQAITEDLSEARRKPQNFEPDFDDDATIAWPGEADLPDTGLGAELTRLEDTLAHLEAEVARNGVSYEAETGDPFAPEGTEPLTELPEAFSAEDWTVATSEDGGYGAAIGAEDATQDVAFEAEPFEDEPTAADMPVEAGAQIDGFAQAPVQEWEDLREGTQVAGGAYAPPEPHRDETPLRRLHLSDAEARAPEPEPRASSYDDLRAKLELEAAGEEHELAALEAELAATPDLPGAALHPAALAMDEQQLRQLVSALLREELQGALGAKITRNLRKLVRREVQRALMSRDLD